MDADPPLDYMLDEPNGAQPGRDELLGIVARSRRHRNRVATAGMAATLAIGGLGGWLAGASRGGAKTTNLATGAPTAGPTTTEQSALSAHAPVGAAAATLPGVTLIKDFLRTTADGVAIRAYLPPTIPKPLGAGACPLPISTLVVEVSTTAIAGEGSGFLITNLPAPLKGVGSSTAGVAEGAPVWVVTVETSDKAAQVRVTFADGKTDQMAPVNGWAALAHMAPPGAAAYPVTGSVEALDAAGKVITSVKIPSPEIPLPPAPGQPTVTVTAVPAQPGAVAGSRGAIPGAGGGGADSGGGIVTAPGAGGGVVTAPGAPMPPTTSAPPPAKTAPQTLPPLGAPCEILPVAPAPSPAGTTTTTK